MQQEKPFKYTIQAKNSKYYYIDSGGNVALSVTEKPLLFAPDGWKDQVLNWNRGMVYFGIMRGFTLENKFVEDGATILKYLFFTYGVNAFAFIRLKKYNTLETVLAYETIYEGEVSFKEYNSQSDYAACKIVEGGFLKDLTAKENVVYEIDIDSHPDKKWIKMDGITLFGKFAYEFAPIAFTQVFLSPTDRFLFQLPFITSEGTSNLLVGQSQLQETFSTPAGANTNFFLYNGEVLQNVILETTLKLDTQIVTPNVVPAVSTDIKLNLIQIDEFNNVTFTNLNTFNHTRNNATPPNTPHTLTTTISLNQTITLNPKCKYQLAVTSTPFSTLGQLRINVLVDTPLTIKTNYTKEATYIPALPMVETIQAIVDKIAAPNIAPTVSSSALSIDNETKLLTSGDAIRGLRGAKIKINFFDLVTSLQNQFGLGTHFISQVNTLQISRLKGGIFQSGQIAHLGVIDDLTITPANEFMFSSFKIGSPSQTYDDVNGREEPNQTNQFTTPLLDLNSEHDFTTKIRTDSYGIEFTRLNLDGKTSTDGTSDNNTFMIDVEDNPSGTIINPITGNVTVPFYKIFRYTFPPAISTGLIAEKSVFNMRLSPKHVLENLGSFIRSAMQPNDGQSLVFASGTKNTNVTLFDGTKNYNEGASEFIGNLDATFFYPIYFEFKTQNVQNIIALMQFPLSTFTFTYNEEDYYGYIIKVSDNPHLPREQTFKLLATANNNLLKLIYRNV
jgi:hypothetical protein